MAKSKVPSLLISAAQEMVKELAQIQFASPVEFVYNPLDYVWDGYSQYVNKYARANVDVLFLGMNPGPWGMAQTGVPFGEVTVVREWLGIVPDYTQPEPAHPARPIQGVECKRSEVSGARLWALFKTRFGTPKAFFEHAYIANYCPLAFMEVSGRNRTPDKLPASERNLLYAICDRHLVRLVEAVKPKWVVGVGQFAEDRATAALGDDYPIRRILHPSPASPASNRDWAGAATKQLVAAGIWT